MSDFCISFPYPPLLLRRQAFPNDSGVKLYSGIGVGYSIDPRKPVFDLALANPSQHNLLISYLGTVEEGAQLSVL